jgi:hypothetical protein
MIDFHPDDATWERLACEELPADDRDRVLAHVLRCDACSEIYRTLLDVRREAREFDPAVVAPRVVMSDAIGSWRRYSLAAAVVLAAVLTVLLWRSRSAAPDESRAAGTPAAASAPTTVAASPLAAQPVFRLEKAPIRLSASAALTPRGESAEDRRRFLDALGDALAPYRADDFAEAASRFSRLSATYPDKVEPAFYAGVSALLAHRASDAVAQLERARAHAPAELIDDVDWQLALAYVHAGAADRAREPLTRLCAGTGAYRQRACEGVKLLGK